MVAEGELATSVDDFVLVSIDDMLFELSNDECCGTDKKMVRFVSELFSISKK